jgi:hypothetical protein
LLRNKSYPRAVRLLLEGTWRDVQMLWLIFPMLPLHVSQSV